MTATPILLAEAMTTVINTAVSNDEFGELSFTARRSYPDWDDDFKDIKDLAVDVVFVASVGSGGDLAELDTFSTLEMQPMVDIAVRKRFSSSDRESTAGRLRNTSVDPIVNLVEQLHELFAGDRNTSLDLGGGLVANWVEANVRTHCDYSRLREAHFLGVVRVTWNVSKGMS